MTRPYIFCHMLISVDGKIMGSYLDTKEGSSAGDLFYQIAFGKNAHYHHQGWLSGRITTDDNFTFYRKPVLETDSLPVPHGDFVAKNDAPMYYVSIDPSGKLGWEKSEVTYIDTTAHIVEVLTEKASNEYKAFLRKLNISYIIAGEDSLNYELTMHKIKTLFGVETLMLGGGGVLNWSFMQEGMCDELSVVIAATADGSSETPALFETRGNLTSATPISFKLKSVNEIDGSVWLRYLVNNSRENK